MHRDRNKSKERLAGTIRRRAGDHATTRFLNTLPVFKVADEIPEPLRLLLERLDRHDEHAG